MTQNASPSLTSHLVTLERLSSISTLVGPQTTMRGDLFASESTDDVGIKIDGRLEGSIHIPKGGVIWVGPHGDVEGKTLEADLIYIAGKVKGNIIGRKGVELTGTCTVEGDIDYHGSLNMHNMARLRGAVRCSDQMA